MKTQILTFIVFAFLFSSCKNGENKRSNETLTNIDLSELRLDNGNKWIVNLETHDGLKNMDAIIKNFKSKTSKEYIVLGETLSKETSVIIKKCSMKGEPHDQLHVVLVPMLDEISTLKETNVNIEAKQVSVEKLDYLIKKYFEHFSL
ncbi:hypothetical protein [Pontimicrobium sp. SW4]|uniref:Uncharacterized protein n=1 Tax=Pontimicrobium sp. SW4 TaxID=3153519 RepID=A0AAU7BRQ0_9FLAO